MVRMTAVTPIELAKQWAEAETKRATLQAEFDRQRTELDNVKIRQETLNKELRATVGANVPQRLFDVGGKTVLVSVERGVQLVEVEKADAPK